MLWKLSVIVTASTSIWIYTFLLKIYSHAVKHVEKGIEIVCHNNNYYCFVLTAAKVVTWELLGNAGYNNYNIAVSKTWYFYRSYWVRSGISTGGQYNSKEGCKPYSIAKCDHHVTGNFISDYCINCAIHIISYSGQYPSCSGGTVSTPSCSTACQSSYNVEYARDKHYGEKFYWINGLDNIMKELYTNGPVEASFLVYEDFLYYKSGHTLVLFSLPSL